MAGTSYNGQDMVRSGAFAGLVLTLMPLLAAGEIGMSDYPDRPVKVIVHTPAGGGTDALARLLFQQAGRMTGVTFVVENHSGAGGQIGYTRLATAAPDGYTIGAITTMSIVTHELTRPDVAYRLRESFVPLARIVFDASALVVREDSPFQTPEDLIDAARARPGKLTWAGTFLWGAHHVHYEEFRRATGAELVYIPFDGAADSRAALLGGHVDVGSGGFSEYASLVREGKLRVLAVGAAARLAEYPDVPTYRDLGYDIVIGSDRGFAAPAGTPPERVEYLIGAIRDAVQSPEFLAAAKKADIASSLAPLYGAEYAAYLAALQEEIAPLVRAAVANAGSGTVLSGTRVFPVSIIVALVALAGWGVTRARRATKPVTGRAGLRLAAFAGIVIAYCFLLPVTGFAVSSIGLMAASMLLLGGRRAVRLLPFAVLLPVALIVIFHYGLGIRLPAAGGL